MNLIEMQAFFKKDDVILWSLFRLSPSRNMVSLASLRLMNHSYYCEEITFGILLS